jgi:hypothetical protein
MVAMMAPTTRARAPAASKTAVAASMPDLMSIAHLLRDDPAVVP